MLLFATVVLIGLVSVWSLSNSNEVSTDVRDRWLPNTRLLGDLNNFTSDYRTAEADSLLAATPAELADSLHDVQVLDQAVARAQRDYERIPHGAEEADLYRQFSSTWTAYKALADRVTALAASGHKAEAAEIYRSKSRTTYDAASDLLGRLTDYNVMRAAQASERSVRAYEHARWWMSGALSAAGLMLAGVIAHVRHSVSRPLLQLGQAMRLLAGNETSINIGHTSRSDEIGEIARTVVVFRDNAIELVRSQRGLVQQATLLEEKLAHEQHVMQLQRNFVSMITHEFRTPLTQIDAQAQRLVNLRDRLRSEDLVERTNRIRSAVSRIIRLIDSLVETARLIDNDANMFFHPEPIDLAVVLHDVCCLHRDISPGVQIMEVQDARPLPVHGDPRLLAQAFGNLLSNAIKYSPSGAQITARVTANSAATSVTIEDQGIGIPDEDKKLIFARYSRARNTSGFVGTGVGLFLVATVARLHGGDVTVESELGKGSRFTLTLPNTPTPGALRVATGEAAPLA